MTSISLFLCKPRIMNLHEPNLIRFSRTLIAFSMTLHLFVNYILFTFDSSVTVLITTLVTFDSSDCFVYQNTISPRTFHPEVSYALLTFDRSNYFVYQTQLDPSTFHYNKDKVMTNQIIHPWSPSTSENMCRPGLTLSKFHTHSQGV